jgi:hypothetical protein
MKDEALKLALEALKNGKRVRNAEGGTKYQPDLEDKALTAIKQALAAPVQEPVATLFGSLPVYDTTPPAAQPAPVQPIIGSYLEKDNSQFKFSDYEPDGMHHNKPAVPDAFGTREGEHPQYIQGWNDCRAEMSRGRKP